MRTTPNLGLTVWDLGTDVYSRVDLMNNWDIIDRNIFTAKQVEILSSLPTTGNFPGRLVMLSAPDSGFPAWSLCRYDGSSWREVGGIEIHATIPSQGNFKGRLVILSQSWGAFPAWTIFAYDGSGWKPVNTLSVYLNGTLISSRRSINWHAGTNTSINMTDDASNNMVNMSISASQPTTALTFQKNGVTVGQKSQVEFQTGTNSLVSVTDDPSNNEIDISFSVQPEVSQSSSLLGYAYWNPIEVSLQTTNVFKPYGSTSNNIYSKVSDSKLSVSFTVPDSGTVFVHLSGTVGVQSARPDLIIGPSRIYVPTWCLVEGSQVVPGSEVNLEFDIKDTGHAQYDIVINGLTPGASKRWSWGYFVKGVTAAATTSNGTSVLMFIGGRGDIDGHLAGPAFMGVWGV